MKIEYFGKMPDPFLKEDGTRMTPDEWHKNKKALLQKITDIEYGGMPPRPEVVKVERLTQIYRSKSIWYKIHAGTKEKQLTFMLEITVPFLPDKAKAINSDWGPDEKYPVLLTGDGCWPYIEGEVKQQILKRGYIVARFNRLEIASDLLISSEGGIHDIYPGKYSDISAWAWGYLVCMDAFEQIGLPSLDKTEVGITGHSRGGKTVMLAAALDERIKYVCINSSGMHGANSYRCDVTEQGAGKKPSETLSGMLKICKTWVGEKLYEYEGRINELPYDMHYFGAMIAPRFYLQNEGMQDYWLNPVGAWQNFMAVKECYKYLGCEENAGAWYKPGEHQHTLAEFLVFLDFMDNARKNLPLQEHLKVNPYPEIEKNFEW